MTAHHLVVGTAGHIDHGKSALVQALTGIDPDRLKEEKRRGITIDLGFADLDLGAGRVLSFVDVPGHERFVRHMVAGATGIDAVVLVVAADDGVRPQTREHLDICCLLEVRHGLVALTKTDLVDEDLRQVVALELRELLRGSFLESSPVVACSARTGDGLDELKRRLGDLFERVPPRPTSGVTRLPVDRSFVLRGFGTVVTGTLASGVLSEGDEVEVLPGRRRARVRGLQVHRESVREARAGQRTAVNLQGVDRDDVPRGATLAAPGALLTSRRLWGRVRLLAGAPEGLAVGGPVRFHQGTCRREARMHTLREEPDGLLTVEIRLDDETVLSPGDRFILRRPAPVDTVGGGVVLDAHPPRGRAARPEASALGSGGDEDAIVVRLGRAGAAGRSPAELASELGLAPDELERDLADLEASGRAVRAAGTVVDAGVWERLAREVAGSLARFHAEEPLLPGMSREGLRGRLCPEMPKEVWRAWLERMEADGALRLEGDKVAASSHRVVLSAEDRLLASRIERRFMEAGLEPPDPSEVVDSEGGPRAERIVDVLIARDRLVRIRDGRLFHREALESLWAKLREYGKTSRTIDVGTFKQLAGVTRKNAIPLLEQSDAERRTRRVGNVREILGSG